jgi:hypothetical protein
MASYWKNKLTNKFALLSKTSFECFHSQRPTISHLTPFGSKGSVNIREAQQESGSKHLLDTRKAIIVGETSPPNVYRVCTLEVEYLITWSELDIPEKDFNSGSDNSLKDFPGPGTGPRIDSPGLRTQGPLDNYIWLYHNPLKILYRIKISVDTYSSIEMRLSYSRRVTI